MYKRILVPLDGTACGEAALPHAQAVAEKFEAEIILLRVVEPYIVQATPTMDAGLIAPGAMMQPELVEDQEAIAQNYVKSAADHLRGSGVIVTEVEWGGAADQIAHCATEHEVDLIVMGTHGRGGLERLFLGSTSEALLHHVNTPILLVKHPHS